MSDSAPKLNSKAGIENEPWLSQTPAAPDPSESKATTVLGSESPNEEWVHSVWDEPGRPATPPPPNAANFAAWLDSHRQATSTTKTWWLTLLLVVFSGLYAIPCCFLVPRPGLGNASLMAIVVSGPLIEEILKASLPLIVVEKRPYLFSSPIQIILCGVASGLVFAFLENLLYLNVYVPNPPESLVFWRWTVCTAVHAVCATIAACGTAHVWKTCMREKIPPQISLGAPWYITAIVLHGGYNLVAVVLHYSENF